MTEIAKPDTDDPVARVEALAAKAAERARKNREMFPEITKVVDMFKLAFGADQIRVTYARENGHEVGTPFVLPPDRTIAIKDMAFTTPREPEPSRTPRKRRRS